MLETIKRLIGLLLNLFFIPAFRIAQAKDNVPPLSLPAQPILSKVQPSIQAKKSPRAIEALKAFQARGGSATGPGCEDPKGYPHEIGFCLGNGYLLSEQYNVAAAAYQRALDRDPSHTFAGLNQANAPYEMNQYADAGHCSKMAYGTATEKNPGYLCYSVVAYLMADDYQQSIDLFEQLFALHPDAFKLEWKDHMSFLFGGTNILKPLPGD